MKLHIFISLVVISSLSCKKPVQETTVETKLPMKAPKVENTTNEIVDTSNYVMTTLLHTNGKEIPTDPNHDFFVINYKGAKIYKAPDFNAALIDTFYCGQGIQKANLTTLQNDSYEIHPEMILEGHWLKMSAPIEGYIFSTDFSDIRPRVTNDLVNMIELLGEQQGETTLKDTTLLINNEYSTYSMKITSYQNGSYRYIELDGCFDYIYTYYGLTFYEAYHQMMSCYLGAYGDENFLKVDVPTFIEKKDGQYLFEGSDATGEVILRQREDGYWETYSYDCT